MRVLLRDAMTGLYFQEPGNWTKHPATAKNFKHSAEAMNLARLWELERAEVVLSFDEPNYLVSLPLPQMVLAQARATF